MNAMHRHCTIDAPRRRARSGLERALIPLFALTLAPSATADTFVMKSGYRIDGLMDSERSTEEQYFVRIGSVGHLLLERARVERVEPNRLDGVPRRPNGGEPAPAAVSEMVTLELRADGFYSGGPLGKLSGVPENVPGDDTYYRLRVPGAGRITVPRAFIASVEPFQADEGSEIVPVVAADGGATITTTHVVHLRDGTKIQGTVVAENDEVVVLTLGAMGRILIPRWRVTKIDRVEGTYRLPPPPPPAAPAEPIEGEEEDAPEEPAPAAEAAASSEPALPPTPSGLDLSPEAKRFISEQVFLLTRQRSDKRVRAENKLREIGPVVVPYLRAALEFDFELTRRAAMRVLRDVGSADAVPLAIEALTDSDYYVRLHAVQTLQRVLGEDVTFSPRAPAHARRLLQAQLRKRYL